jgi:serine/threonine protein phosphatase PrpC
MLDVGCWEEAPPKHPASSIQHLFLRSEMQPQLQLRVGARSHAGKVRAENQDRMSRFQSPIGEVFIVADGMGGHQGGATAAAMTNDGFASYLSSLPPGVVPEAALQEAAKATNAEIYRRANSGDPATARMGATAVLAVVNGSRLLIAHAGDSRAYLFRNSKLIRLTRDHSAVQQMIDHNMLTEEEARDHPDASIINRAFGQKPDIDLEISQAPAIQSGDGVLLCTDGLCGYIDDAEIARAINSCEEPQDATDALINLALDAGGEDNVTVQFLQFGQRSRVRIGAPLEDGQPRRTPVIITTAEKPLAWWEQRYVKYTIGAIVIFLLGVFLSRFIPLPDILGRFSSGPTEQSPEKQKEKTQEQTPTPRVSPSNPLGHGDIPETKPSPSPAQSSPQNEGGEQRSGGASSTNINTQPKTGKSGEAVKNPELKEAARNAEDAAKGAAGARAEEAKAADPNKDGAASDKQPQKPTNTPTPTPKPPDNDANNSHQAYDHNLEQ